MMLFICEMGQKIACHAYIHFSPLLKSIKDKDVKRKLRYWLNLTDFDKANVYWKDASMKVDGINFGLYFCEGSFWYNLKTFHK